MARKHTVRRGLTLGDAAQNKPFGQFHGHVLDAVYGKVGAVFKQGFFNFFYKKTLAPHLCQRNILNDVAPGFDDGKFNRQFGIKRQQAAFYVLCLPQGQLAATGSDNERFTHACRLMPTACAVAAGTPRTAAATAAG